MSDSSKPTTPQAQFPRVTRLGHGAPLHVVDSRRKTQLGVAPPRAEPTAHPAPPSEGAMEPTLLLLRRKEDDAFASRPTNKLPDKRLVPPAARAAFQATWGGTLRGPVDPSEDPPPVTVTAPPRGLRAWVARLLRRLWGAT